MGLFILGGGGVASGVKVGMLGLVVLAAPGVVVVSFWVLYRCVLGVFGEYFVFM